MKYMQVVMIALVLLCSTVVMAGQQVLETTYYHNDVLGSPIAASNAAGNLLWEEDYYPYGKRINADPGSSKNRRWYTGHVEDKDTGLVYAGARYYDPSTGRFLGIDPVGFNEGNIHSFNRYAYANNNPYKYVDPDGRIVETAWDIANVVMDVSSMGINLAAGNYGGAAVDAAGLGVDLLATVVPGMPGGAGTAIHMTRAADKARDVVKAGGGAKVDNIPEAARDRIQDFANKYDTDVTVVGSRAKKTGGNGSDSDWDYIMSNPPGKLRKRGEQQLPKGRAGGEMGSGQDFLDGPVDPSRPHITFTPKK